MKISLFSIADIALGKHNVQDPRLNQIYSLTNSKKTTYVQVEFVGEDAALDADIILVSTDSKADLILKDLEFVETRLSRSAEESEKALLNKLKSILEKEGFIFHTALSEEEKKTISGYGLLSNRPVIVAQRQGLGSLDDFLLKGLGQSGYISFFTAMQGGRETRAWLIKKGTTAWEAAGAIHSDIQKGFIRAEIIIFNDYIQAGGETQAKQAGKMRLEQKDYVMQDGDIVNFRFNK